MMPAFHVEETPNPKTRVFRCTQVVHRGDPVEFRRQDEPTTSTFLDVLLREPGVSDLLVTRFSISVTRCDEASWAEIQPRLLRHLSQLNSQALPLEIPATNVPAAAGADDQILVRIRTVLNEEIRPALMYDGGDVVLVSFHDGVAHLLLRGACRACPSSRDTLQHGISTRLRSLVPEVLAVTAQLESENP